MRRREFFAALAAARCGLGRRCARRQMPVVGVPQFRQFGAWARGADRRVPPGTRRDGLRRGQKRRPRHSLREATTTAGCVRWRPNCAPAGFGYPDAAARLGAGGESGHSDNPDRLSGRRRPGQHGLVAKPRPSRRQPTGISMLTAGLVEKRLEFVREVISEPGVIAFSSTARTPMSKTSFRKPRGVERARSEDCRLQRQHRPGHRSRPFRACPRRCEGPCRRRRPVPEQPAASKLSPWRRVMRFRRSTIGANSSIGRADELRTEPRRGDAPARRLTSAAF